VWCEKESTRFPARRSAGPTSGRIVVVFCAFEGPPNIVRLHGRGTVRTPDDESWTSLLAHFPRRPGVRAVVAVDVLTPLLPS